MTIFERLRDHLDALPHGFPPAADGVELRILAKIFTPGEAELALALLPVPEPAEAIARRIGRGPDETAAALDAMAVKGEIAALRHGGRRMYTLVPFVFGIYEFQLPRMDAELAALCEDYMPTLHRVLGGYPPALGRVVPVNQRIEAEATVLRHENVKTMLEGARSIRVMDCVCRKERAVLGKACGAPVEVCLAFSREEGSLDDFPSYGRVIERDEAYRILDRAERAGLVHCTYNVQSDQIFVCNCCPCCCGFLRGIKESHAPHILVRSNFVARVDDALCGACGACLTRCPLDALTAEGGTVRVDGARCIGCGVCTIVCAKHALDLVMRPAAECTTPPGSMLGWAFRRAHSRFGLVGAVTRMARLGPAATRWIVPRA